MLGPSGSGKTTCLRLIAGFEQPTAGHIEIFGETAEGVPPYRRNVNTVFQDYALFPHLNVLDNVAYGLMVKGVGKAERAQGGRGGAGAGRAARLRRAQARPAFRRPAPARGAGPRAGQPAQGAAARRAARRARPQAARADAGGAEGAAEVARHHLRLRHPRPGRGAVDGRPRRRLQRRPDRAGRHAARRSTSGPNTRFVADFVGSSNVLPPDFVERYRRPAALGEPAAGSDRDRRAGGQRRRRRRACRAAISAPPPASPSTPRARACMSIVPAGAAPCPAEGSTVALAWCARRRCI